MKSYLPASTAFSRYALPCISSLVLGVVLLALAPTQAIGQCTGYQVDVPDHCTCNDPSGYTVVTIKVTAAAAQNWTVKAQNGLYDPMNTALLIPIGAPLTDAGGGMYTLDAKRKNTDGYWIQVTNGACDLDIRVGNPDPCTANLLTVNIDPDGTPNNGDEYTLYVHPTDNSTSIEWGGFGTDIPTLANITTTAAANADFDGVGNTQKIVDALGNNSGTAYAAKLCADLVDNGCDDWYLPAAGELKAMYDQLGPGGENGFANEYYWSSSEYNLGFAWLQYFVDGFQFSNFKDSFYRCRCVRR
ncbi:MAG: DUF1566 domain-containing protein [Lewinellaceae bacterium]|nr:DUF1566 domain-containing protein [Lewinellaceae bacterium]